MTSYLMTSYLMKRIFIVGISLWISVSAFFFASSTVASDRALSGASAELAIRRDLEKIIKYVDSEGYKNKVSWEEHLILIYQLAQERSPTAPEFYLLGKAHADRDLSRSDALSLAIRGTASGTTSWSQCAAFLDKKSLKSFAVNDQVRQAAIELQQKAIGDIIHSLQQESAQLMATPAPVGPPARMIESAAPNVVYNTYYGYLHAHSELSDGAGSADEAYRYARDVAGLDFFALTDHGEELAIWPWENKWQVLKSAAQEHYIPGEYATLWGFEWSNPIQGHITVLNSTDYTDAVSNFSLAGFASWLVNRPQAFGRFNHPGDYDDLFSEFYHLALYIPARMQMVGMENWNRNAGFDQYFYSGGYTTDRSYWDEGNRKLWYLGSLGGQDNHTGLWGTMNDFRTAVLALELTREAIVDAYFKRRFYATEDKDLVLDVRVAGYPMGSVLYNQERKIYVSACDGSGDTFLEVRLYRNGDLIQTQATNGTCLEVVFDDTAFSSQAYYYVVVTQNDDNDSNGRNDEAISSPIWIL